MLGRSRSKSGPVVNCLFITPKLPTFLTLAAVWTVMAEEDVSTWGDAIEGTDNQLFKKVLTEGAGETAPDGCTVQVHCE